MNIDRITKEMNTKPNRTDTERTQSWKNLLEAAKAAEERGNDASAIMLYERVLELVETRLGSGHLLVAHILMQCARLFEKQGEMAVAQEFIGRAREALAKQVQTLDFDKF